MNATPLIVVDTDRHVTKAVQKNGKYSRVELTPKEHGLLVFIARAEGRVVTRGQALERLWNTTPDAGVDSRTVDQHMARLRDKLGPAAAPAIVTVTCAGYKIEPGTVQVVSSRDLLVHIEKVNGEYRNNQPGYALSVWMPHTDPAPKPKQKMRLAEVR